ncbi:MAG TPA: glycosyltransferase family 87 protein [Anaerolineales bacterium]|nr:glycosyltransferase family 87 protein [Anaerolineales bacterium]
MKFAIPKPIRILLTLVALGLLIFARVQIGLGTDVPNSNFSFFWLAGRMILDGQNPYDEAQYLAGHDANGMEWQPNKIFPYPLPMALFCIPLGFFSMYTANLLWQVTTLLLTALAIYVLLKHWQGTSHHNMLVPIFFFMLAWGPLYMTIQVGAVSVFSLVVLLGAILLLERDKSLAAGILLAFTMLKPPQGLTILLLVGVWFLARRDWKGIIGVALGGLIIFVVGYIQDPQWVQKFLGAGDAVMARTLGVHSNVWAFAYIACEGASLCSNIFGGILSLSLLGGAALLLWRNQAQWSAWEAMNVIIPVGFVSTIYLWVYDQLPFVIPIVWIVGTLVQKQRSILFAFIFLILLDLVSIFAVGKLALTNKDLWSLGSTVMVLLFLFIARRVKQRPAKEKISVAA